MLRDVPGGDEGDVVVPLNLVHHHHHQQQQQQQHGASFATSRASSHCNRISNTKYTLVTFLPKNLLEQFGRFMNMYFLLIAVLQMWSRITPVNPATTWGPLFVIFAFTACKEAYDDICRHRMDQQLNNRPFTVLVDGHRRAVKSEQLMRGDTVLLEEGSEVPCDLVLLACSSDDGICYVETAAMDGETDLKIRRVPNCCLGMSGSQLTSGIKGEVVCGAPDGDCHAFRGSIALRSSDEEVAGAAGISGSSSSLPALQESLDVRNTLLQTCHLRNTSWVIAVVVNTGNETKFGMCKGAVPTKVSRVDRRIDCFTASVFCGQIFVVFIMGSLGNSWQSAHASSMYYLQASAEVIGSSWLESAVIPLRFLLLCSMAVPISLKVTMDVVKTFYAVLIGCDNAMKDESGSGAVANNTSISEDLGQVKYVLCDKTGTLTENKMRFKFLFLDGHHYGGNGPVALQGIHSLPAMIPDSSSNAQARRTSMSAPENLGALDSQDPLDLGNGALQDAALRALLRKEPQESKGPASLEHRRGALALRVLALCNSAIPREAPAHAAAAAAVHGAAAEAQQQQLQGPGMARAPSVDQLPREQHPGPSSCSSPGASSSEVSYTAASPDEHELVQAAAQLGAALVHRRGKTSVLRVQRSDGLSDALEEYSVLNVLEFTSERRCMSVLVSLQGSGEILLLTKGGDDAVMEKLAAGEDTREASRALELYARQGLRTLCLAARVVDKGEYAAWSQAFSKAQVMMQTQGKEEEITRLQMQMERSLQLLGVTAIEDQLQPGVPQTIKSLKEAGVSCWMLTGDKAATAIQLSYACGLNAYEPHGRTIAVTSTTCHEVGEMLRQVLQELADPLLPHQLCLALDGHALQVAMEHHSDALMQAATRCSSVIFCRVTPGQKAAVARLLKQRKPKDVVLAIGDGGNDVGMIQASDVGVGISGQEGQQAARAADYSIPSFKSLARLVLIHGRYSAVRTSFIAMYCIYKSIMLCFMQLLFATSSGLSGTSFHNSFALMAYNVLFTLTPSLSYALNRDIEQDVLLSQPYLLRPVQSSQCVSYPVFANWLMMAVYHAAVVYGTMMGALGHPSTGGKIGGDMELVAMAAYSGTIWVNAVIVTLESNTISALQVAGIWGIVPLFYAVSAAISSSPRLGMPGVMSAMLCSPAYWIALVLAVLLSVVPLAAKYVWRAGAQAQIKEMLHHHSLRLLRWRKGRFSPSSSLFPLAADNTGQEELQPTGGGDDMRDALLSHHYSAPSRSR